MIMAPKDDKDWLLELALHSTGLQQSGIQEKSEKALQECLRQLRFSWFFNIV